MMCSCLHSLRHGPHPVIRAVHILVRLTSSATGLQVMLRGCIEHFIYSSEVGVKCIITGLIHYDNDYIQ